MFSRIVSFILITFIVECYSNEECAALKNSKIKLYIRGGGILEKTTINDKENLENAYKIEIQDQDIPNLCEGSVQNLHKLTDLIIYTSGVKKIHPGAFDNLSSLRNLIISGNDIGEIQADVFGNLLMRKLVLSNNKISTIKPRAFENMMNLEVLDLNTNLLQTFDSEWFKYTPKLYRLDFMNNNIEAIPKNAFSAIIKDKQKKFDLELFFSNNSISNIHKQAFNGLEKIEDIWLSGNSLSNIDIEVFTQIQHIEALFLDNNQFTCFSDQFLKYLKVRELNIDGNPIDCACAEKIKQWGIEKGTEVTFLRVRLHCVIEKLAALQQLTNSKSDA